MRHKLTAKIIAVIALFKPFYDHLPVDEKVMHADVSLRTGKTVNNFMTGYQDTHNPGDV